MPWTGKTFAKRHNKKLASKPKVAAKAAAQANAILRETGDEGKAIRIASANAKRGILQSQMHHPS